MPLFDVKNYCVGKLLCKTYFGSVYVATCEDKEVVCKISNRMLIQNARQGTIEDPAKEVDFLEKLSYIRERDGSTGSNNFIDLVDTFQDATHDWTVLEYARQGDMFELVHKGGLKNNAGLVREYFRQCVEGVRYLHKYNIAHRDLSLENFFVTTDNIVKIGDFGQARMVEVDDEGKVKELVNAAAERAGKPGYMAPEIHDGMLYDPKAADVFALGVSLFVALTAIPPFAQADQFDRCWKFVKEKNLHKLVYSWKLNIDKQAVDLIQGMLNPEQTRLSLDQVLRHPFLDSDISMAG